MSSIRLIICHIHNPEGLCHEGQNCFSPFLQLYGKVQAIFTRKPIYLPCMDSWVHIAANTTRLYADETKTRKIQTLKSYDSILDCELQHMLALKHGVHKGKKIQKLSSFKVLFFPVHFLVSCALNVLFFLLVNALLKNSVLC